ncbi:unnamed protein product [Tetraodon nigroviridis]|uniref:Exocyst complex component Sec8 n=1 Tax=Tetraodon nigroviridis TaxID=99883 RepID=Q4STR0_TETNG|nr:unnamed protein product [Tetraodon nigroviridis]
MAADSGRYRSTINKNKDPSGLLISVIRTLSSSDDLQDRETEKGRLEEAFETCDRDLDELIVQHYAELTTAIRTYQSITERITSSRNKIKQVKENLLSCKMLLHCKRDELRKLWIEGIEHKHVLQLLDEIERIKQMPQLLETYMASKHYLHATDMLVSNYSAAKDTSPIPILDVSSISTPRKLLESSQFSTPGSSSVRELQQDVKEFSLAELPEVDPEENSAEFMGILIKALAKLKKIPDTIKAIMERLEPELKQIVKRSTTQIADHAYREERAGSPDGVSGCEEQPECYGTISTALIRQHRQRVCCIFCKRETTEGEESLFKFESSSHAISMSAYLREQRRELYSKSGELQGGADDNLIEGGEMKFVCKPGARNITVIFQPLLR